MIRNILKILLKETTAQELHKRAIDNIMKRFDLKESDKMGEGTYGSVFNYGQNLVLKITRDSSEAVFANGLKNKKFKHIANIESVFKMKNYPGYFVIILEKLKPINDEKFMDVIYFLKDDDIDRLSKLIPNEEKRNFYIHQYNEMVKELDSLKISDGWTDLHGGNIGIKNGNLACYDLQVVDLPQWRLGKIKSFK